MLELPIEIAPEPPLYILLWLYFFVNLAKEYSPALFQYNPFENRDAFMNLCPRLCVRNVVK